MPLKDENEATDGSSNESSVQVSKQQEEADDEVAIEIAKKSNKEEAKMSNDERKKHKEKLLRLRQQRTNEAAVRVSNSNKTDSKSRRIERRQQLRRQRTDEAAVRTSTSNKKDSKSRRIGREKYSIAGSFASPSVEVGAVAVRGEMNSEEEQRTDEVAVRTSNSNKKASKSRQIESRQRLRRQRAYEAAVRTSTSNKKDSKSRRIGREKYSIAGSFASPSVEVGAVAVRDEMNSEEEDDDVEDYSADDDVEGNGDGVTRHPTSSSTYSDRDNDSTIDSDLDMNSIEMCSSSSSSSQLQSSYNNSNSHLQLSFNSDSLLPQASPVDMDALKAEYQVASRGSVLQRMRAEMTVADEIVENNNNVRSNSKFRIMISAVTFIIIAIVIGVVIASTKKGHGMDKKQFAPTTSPTLSNFIILQEQMKSISGDTVFDDSSPQYMALSWLAYEDSFILDIQTSHDFADELLDRYVLAVVYFSTGGRNWVNDLNFLTNSSVCNWNKHYNENEGGVISHGNTLSNGVHCDNRGVTKILLDRNHLNGTIPFEIGTTLKHVDEISISNNYVHGTIPSSFGNLFRLEFLEASSNLLSGPIPTTFSHLTKSEYFSTKHNHLTGPIPSGITNLVSLERLDLSVNELTGPIPEFSLRNSLEYLSIFNNFLDGPLPESLVELSHLEVLNLSNNSITGTLPSRLGMLENLSYLFLFENNIGGSLPVSIGDLDVLRTLALYKNSFTGTIPSEIGKLTKLQRIYFDQNSLSGTIPTEVGQCTGLHGFYFQNNPELSGTIPFTSSTMYRLEIFLIHNTSITGSLDELVCPLGLPATADCGGLSPKVNCTCCATCCDPISGICKENLDTVCDKIESIAATYYGHTADCTCRVSAGFALFDGFTCNFEECPTCNEDNTVCGSLHKAGGYQPWSVLSIEYHNKFEYSIGRNETIVWDETPEVDCDVSINGQQCNECSVHYCRDGFPARYIDCTNIVDVADGGVYDTCQHYEKGGVLEYISWWDTFLWTGCLPFYYVSHQ